MLITLQPSETLWTTEGYHLLNDQGIAVTASEVTEIDIADDRYDAVIDIIKAGRSFQGLDPDTGLALPPPVELTPKALPEGEVTNG
jgi:hypothetical protein